MLLFPKKNSFSSVIIQYYLFFVTKKQKTIYYRKLINDSKVACEQNSLWKISLWLKNLMDISVELLR